MNPNGNEIEGVMSNRKKLVKVKTAIPSETDALGRIQHMAVHDNTIVVPETLTRAQRRGMRRTVPLASLVHEHGPDCKGH